MKNFKLIVLLTLVLLSGASADYIGSPNQINAGGTSGPGIQIPEANPSTYVTLETANNSSGVDTFWHFYKGPAPYIVPTGKTFKVRSVCYGQNSAANTAMGQLATTTNNFTEGDGTGSVSNATYEFGASARYAMYAAATNTIYCENKINNNLFTSGRYPAFQVNFGASGKFFVSITGKEE